MGGPPIFSSPVEWSSNKKQVPGECQGGGDGVPKHHEVQHWGLAVTWGACIVPPNHKLLPCRNPLEME